MPRRSSNDRPENLRPLSSFTLIELLVVIAIIAILAALTLAAASQVMATGARNRARAEIQAMSTALESYKTDNGTYPVGAPNGGADSSLVGPPNGSYPNPTGLPGDSYQLGSEALYQALAGRTNYTDPITSSVKYYMTFKATQLGNDKATSVNPIYVQDPFGYAYGYSTGSATPAATPANPNPTPANYPYNGVGFFDLWSTDGLLTDPKPGLYATNSWINNWQ